MFSAFRRFGALVRPKYGKRKALRADWSPSNIERKVLATIIAEIAEVFPSKATTERRKSPANGP
jgi:hypothetical protein